MTSWTMSLSSVGFFSGKPGLWVGPQGGEGHEDYTNELKSKSGAWSVLPGTELA